MVSSGSMVSSILSLPTTASHNLNGSAFGDGMDCIIRKSCSVLTTSVERFLPSSAVSFNCLQFVSSSSAPSFFRRFFMTAQYVLALRWVGWSVSTETASTIEKSHSSFSSSHTVRMRFFSKSHTFLSSSIDSTPPVDLVLSRKRHHATVRQLGMAGGILAVFFGKS